MDRTKIVFFCDRWIIRCFYLLVIAIPFSRAIVEIASTLIIMAWLLKKIFQRDLSIPYTPLALLIPLFVLLNIISMHNTSFGYVSIRGLAKIFQYLMIFFIVVDYMDKPRFFEKLVHLSLIVCSFIAVDGLIQYFIGFDLIRQRHMDVVAGKNRMTASFEHPNDFGAYLVLIIPLFMSLAIFGRLKRKFKILSFSAITLLFIALALTYSRGAWVGVLAGITFLAIVHKKRLVPAILILFLVGLFFIPSSFRTRVLQIFAFNNGSNQERVLIWRGAIKMIEVHPLIGHGVNTFCVNYPKYSLSQSNGGWYAHNCYLQMAGEIGLIGVSVFLLMMLVLFANRLRALKCLGNGNREVMLIGILSGLFGFLVHSFVDTNFYSLPLAVAFWFFCGLAMGTIKLEDREEEKEKAN